MPNAISGEGSLRIAGLELNALLLGEVLPREIFDGSRIAGTTPVYDINGEVLFHRVSVSRGRQGVGYADIAAFDGFAEPLLAVAPGFGWSEKAAFEQALANARKVRRDLRYDTMRLVAYSFPKLAVQFLQNDKEVLMIELGSGAPVPERPRREPGALPSNFERWSYIDELPRDNIPRARASLRKRISEWDDLCPPLKPPRGFDPRIIDVSRFLPIVKPILAIKTDSRELHYSPLDTDHHTCYELRGQLTNVWCVGASVHMILDFYRYNYTQVRIAEDLDLGTLANPNGLPYSRVGDVVTVLQALSNNALTANMNTNPNFAEFRNEIRANRPLISFIPGHSRTVAGYTSTRIFSWYLFQGLLVYDPWPPTTGVITRWENFQASTYTHTYSAHVTLT